MRAMMWAMTVVAACGGVAPEASVSAEGLAKACSALDGALASVVDVPDADKQGTAWTRARQALSGDEVALTRLEELVANGREGGAEHHLKVRAGDPDVAVACAPFMEP